jgi:hypothetical protein
MLSNQFDRWIMSTVHFDREKDIDMRGSIQRYSMERAVAVTRSSRSRGHAMAICAANRVASRMTKCIELRCPMPRAVCGKRAFTY